MDAVYDPEFHAPVKSKSRNTWIPSLRALGRFACVVALGGLAIIPAQNAPGRWRNLSRVSRGAYLNPNGTLPPPQARMGPRIAASNHFVRPAPVGIDERFLVPAPTGIDERMIYPNQVPPSGRWPVAPLPNAPVSPYVVPVPMPQVPPR